MGLHGCYKDSFTFFPLTDPVEQRPYWVLRFVWLVKKLPAFMWFYGSTPAISLCRMVLLHFISQFQAKGSSDVTMSIVFLIFQILIYPLACTERFNKYIMEHIFTLHILVPYCQFLTTLLQDNVQTVNIKYSWLFLKQLLVLQHELQTCLLDYRRVFMWQSVWRMPLF
jgi:hypothetical protein